MINPFMQPFNIGTPFAQEQGVSGTPMVDPRGQQQRRGAKNEKLAYMLYALGGALRGDKNFVQNTLALQQMQEGKKKKEAQKKKYEDFLANLPDGSFKDLAEAMGPEKLDTLLLEQFKATTVKPPSIRERINMQELEALQALREYKGNEEEFKQKQPGLYAVYETLLRKDPTGIEAILDILNRGKGEDPLELLKD